MTDRDVADWHVADLQQCPTIVRDASHNGHVNEWQSELIDFYDPKYVASRTGNFWTSSATQREQRRFWSPGRSRRDAAPGPRFLEKLPCELGFLPEFVQEANAHVDPCACSAMLVQVGIAAGPLQQRLDPADAEEFDAKDPTEIPEYN